MATHPSMIHGGTTRCSKSVEIADISRRQAENSNRHVVVAEVARKFVLHRRRGVVRCIIAESCAGTTMPDTDIVRTFLRLGASVTLPCEEGCFVQREHCEF